MGNLRHADQTWGLPTWVPQSTEYYLQHTMGGVSIRALARLADMHASTVLRQIRRLENRRDDPLVDEALRRLSSCVVAQKMAPAGVSNDEHAVATTSAIRMQGMPALRSLLLEGAVLAVARDMEKGVVVRDSSGGAPQRLAVVDQHIAQALALNEWIESPDATARVARYRITSAGRMALKEHMAAEENKAQGFSEQGKGFLHVEEDIAERRYSPGSESPLNGLARRKDRDGKPFLLRALVIAGERLREEYELGQMQSGGAQDWEAFLVGGKLEITEQTAETGPSAARMRVAAALTELGPGLGDVALRACCYLEGMESLEKRMGWSARSGKIVLRIALQRLQRHFEQSSGNLAPPIG